MPIQTASTQTILGATFVVDYQANTTAEANITGVAAGTLWQIETDNTLNPTQDVWVKIYDHASPADSTDPDIVMHATKGKRTSLALPEGFVYATALSFLCVTSPLNGVGSHPSNRVVVRILAD